MKIKKFLPYFIAVPLISIALYFIFTTMPLVRLWADDFCSSAMLHKIGFLRTQTELWNTWTGRYSATFTTAFIELMGPWAAKILPGILLILLTVSARKIFFGNSIFALLFTVLVMVSSPNLIQTFYWQTGSLNYLIPFVFLNLFLSLFLTKRKKFYLPAAFLLMIIAGGFSETFAVASFILIAFINTGILIAKPKSMGKYLAISLAGLAGAAASLLLVYIAPGNLIREATVTKPPSLSFVIGSTIWATKWFLMKLLATKTFLSSLAMIFMFSYLFHQKLKLNLTKNILLMFLAIITGIFVDVGVMGLGYFSMSTVPPDRALFVITSMILFCFFAFSVLFWNLIHNRINGKGQSKMFWIVSFLYLIFSFLVGASIWKNWTRTRTEIKTYAVSWDKEVKNLPVINNFPSVGGLDDFTVNGGWVASCMAGYYNFPGVTIIK